MGSAACILHGASSPGAFWRVIVTGLAVVFGVVGAGCRDRAAAAPDDVAMALYRTLALQQVRGAPSPAQLAAIEPYLGADLHARLRAAREMHDAERARAPDEKPPFADGDLFTSLFEGPTSFTVVSDVTSDGTHHVTMRFTYDKASSPVIWTDEVVVSSESGRWVVTDVIYGGHWDFANKGSLRSALSLSR